MACHNIAVFVYKMDDGAYKHVKWTDWCEKGLANLTEGSTAWDRSQYSLITPFIVSPYRFPEDFPDGIADVVAYWAEFYIFGGIVLFERGESAEEVSLNIPVN